MKKKTWGDVVHPPCHPSLSFPSRVASNLGKLATFGLGLCLCPCCRGLCGAVEDVGCHSPCSTCYTSRHTPSPTFLSPSGHDPPGLDPLVHMKADPEQVAFDHRGYGCGNHRGIETVILTYRALLLPPLPSPLHGTQENVVSQSACNHRILNENETVTLSARNCVHCDERKGTGGKTCRESGSGTDLGSKSMTWILSGTLIWNGSKESG